MRRGTALVLASLLLGTVSFARPASAQAAADDRASRHDVALTASGSLEETKLLDETLRELLGRLGLRVVPGDAGGSSLLAKVDVDLAGVSITVTDGRDGSVVAQRTLARSGSSTLVCEETAHAIRAIVASELLDPEKAEKRRPPAPQPEPPVASTGPEPSPPPPTKEGEEPRPPAGYGLDVATFASGGPFADQKTFVPRFGLGASFGSRRGLRPSIGVALQYALPFETTGSVVGSHANVISPRALAGIEVVRAPWIALEVGAGGGVDVISVDGLSAVLPSSAIGPETTRVDPILSAVVTARFPLVPGVVFTTAIGVDTDLSARAYVANDGERQNDVLVPWRVRPQLALGFAFTALGEATFR